MYDAVTVFSKALSQNKTFINEFSTNPISCSEYRYSTISSSGRDVLNKIDEVNQSINHQQAFKHFDNISLQHFRALFKALPSKFVSMKMDCVIYFVSK